VTGVVSPLGFRETIDLALRLQPDTNAVAVVAGATSLDGYWLAALHSAIARHQDRVKEIEIRGPPDRQLLARVAALPPHTVVIFQVFPEFSNQQAFGASDLASEVAKRLPTYTVFTRLCVNGCIGGAFQDKIKEWLLTGKLASRLLSGERPKDVPVVYVTDLRPTVDWRTLRKWRIPESRLPPGSVILYRPPSLWEGYRNYVIAVMVVIVALSLLIVGLLWQRARKRKAEVRLRESEERFRVMADTTPSLIWMCDVHGKITYLNERRIAFTGPDLEARYGETWIANVHPDDVKNVLETLYGALETQQAFSQEYRLRRSDGVYRWMFDVASPRMNGDGSFAGFIGSAIDVTDQKLAQQALEKMSGQLIGAQEKERSRIARELHDDIGQRLALLAMELEQANRSANESPTITRRHLEEIRNHCSEIADDVQSLSHQLHSSRLDLLGIAAAIKGFCNEFAKKHEVDIEFIDENVPSRLSNDISLCLFRVAQEALHNAVKYSGVSQFSVEVRGTGDEIRLVVRDGGAGFDAQEAKRNRGLGLQSMQERMHLVHGRLTVESKPGKGTRIVAVVPLNADYGNSLADGTEAEKDEPDKGGMKR
jgi:PAS domain S-box-containing protein